MNTQGLPGPRSPGLSRHRACAHRDAPLEEVPKGL